MVKESIKDNVRLINQVLIALFCFNGSLQTKCMSLNNEPCIIRYAPFNLNIGGPAIHD